MQKITVVGPGRLGGALAIALSRSGHEIESIVYRSRRPAKRLQSALDPPPPVIAIQKVQTITSPIVMIAVQDGEIASVAESIAPALSGGKAVFHTSGSLSSDQLAPLRKTGIAIGSFHPLASISNWTDGPERFRNTFFCIEGDDRAVRVGKKLASALGGRPLVISSLHKSLYHAAAVTAAGHVTALFDIAVAFMERSGVDRPTARKMLQPLLAGVADNLNSEDTYKALTGTYARADEGTMRRHLRALNRHATKDETLVFLELALRSLFLAEKSGADAAKLKRMRKELTVAKRSVG